MKDTILSVLRDRRSWSLLIHTSVGAGIGYTVSSTLEPRMAFSVLAGVLFGGVVFMTVETRKLRKELEQAHKDREVLLAAVESGRDLTVGLALEQRGNSLVITPTLDPKDMPPRGTVQ